METPSSSCRGFFLIFRNLTYAGLAYILVIYLFGIHSTGSIYPFSNERRPSTANPEKKPTGNTKSGLSSGTNWRLRPASLVIPRDDYLGPRPHVDTFVNYTRVVEVCRGSEEGLEKMRFVYDCLKYLNEEEKDYTYIPVNPPSRSDVVYPEVGKEEKPSLESPGTCAGPIVLYHTYWTGPFTWRVELFVKAYLHTQNIPCSRLHIWLDADAHPNCLEEMMSDKGFEKFLPLVVRGDIILHEWKFPSRIPLPSLPENAYNKYKERSPTASSSDTSNSAGTETVIGDNVVRDEDGSEWLIITPRQLTFLPVAISDAVRFVVLHLWGGVYCDMDILMLRDFRPLLLPPNHNFAERWAVHSHPGDYNTAVMALTANSSLSTYLLRGGVRMGVNFHPRIIGRMAWKDGRNEEFTMFETGLFDPIWGEFNWGREGRCTVPCFRDYQVAFVGERVAVQASGEWESWDGEKAKEVYPREERERVLRDEEKEGSEKRAPALQIAGARQAVKMRHSGSRKSRIRKDQIPSNPPLTTAPPDPSDLHTDSFSEDTAPYDFHKDRYPPNNRTMEHFFRGAYSYHIHNSWHKHPQPNSWFDIIMKAHDGFLGGDGRANPYGEKWTGPRVGKYERWREFD